MVRQEQALRAFAAPDTPNKNGSVCIPNRHFIISVFARKKTFATSSSLPVRNILFLTHLSLLLSSKNGQITSVRSTGSARNLHSDIQSELRVLLHLSPQEFHLQ